MHRAWSGIEKVPFFQGHPSHFLVTWAQNSTILTKIECFQTVTRVWIHRYLRNNAQSFKWDRRGALLFFRGHLSNFKVTRGEKSDNFDSNLAFPDDLYTNWDSLDCKSSLNHRYLQNNAQSLRWDRRGALLFFEVIHQISRSHEPKIVNFDPNWAFPDCNSSLNLLMARKSCTKLDAAWKRCPVVFKVIC